MAQVLLFNTNYGSSVKVLSNQNGYLLNTKCSIFGIKTNCVSVGSLFSIKNISFAFIHTANLLGHDLTTKEGIDKALADKDNIIRKFQSMENEIKEAESKMLDQENERKQNIRNIIVTTGDLKEDYTVLGPVYFQVSNKGLFTTELSRLVKQNADELALLRTNGQIGKSRNDWGALYGEFSVGQRDFDKAFFVGIQELKKRCALLGGDAIICMRQDIDLDTTNIQHFYMQMYGTAVKKNVVSDEMIVDNE